MTATIDFKDMQRRMDGAIGAYKNDLGSLRTGRASANLLDPVNVEAYGTSMPINASLRKTSHCSRTSRRSSRGASRSRRRGRSLARGRRGRAPG